MKVCDVMELDPGTLVRHYRQGGELRQTQWAIVAEAKHSGKRMFRALAWIETVVNPDFPVVMVETYEDSPLKVYSTGKRAKIFADLHHSEMNAGPPECPSSNLLVIGDHMGFATHLVTDRRELAGDYFVSLDGKVRPWQLVLESATRLQVCPFLEIVDWRIETSEEDEFVQISGPQ